MHRLYQTVINEHFALYNKMLFLAGPRQVGKTTIAKAVQESQHKIAASSFHYLNWDNINDQQTILEGPNVLAQTLGLNELESSKKGIPIIVFDEIHKFSRWKNFLKGFFDTYQKRVRIIVTGSAKLDIFRSGGDSLRGRYFLYRIHPLSIAECVRTTPNLNHEISPPKEIKIADFNALFNFGGFPEPFLERNQRFYNRWRRLSYHQLFREDIRDLSRIQEVAHLEKFAMLIGEQAGQLVNYSTLSVKLGVSVHTIKKWIDTLAMLYYCFTITPWSKKISRSLIKQPKVYLWDWSGITDEGARLENFVACHLLKAIHFWIDSGFGDYNLHFIRDKSGKEVDFLITKDGHPWFLIEVKKSRQNSLSKNLHFFHERLMTKHAFQAVLDMPYVDANCFMGNLPVIVPIQTLLSQLV